MEEKGELGVIAEGYYDYQEIRKSQYNRIRDIVRRKIENIPMDKPEEKKEKKKYLKKFDDKKILKYLIKLEKQNKIQKQEHKYLSKLLEIAKETHTTEKKYKILLMHCIKQEEIWNKWLQNIKGISSVLAGNLVKNFGYCEDYKYVSSLWRHTGYDPDGAKGRVKGNEIHYNPKLKTLMWKVSDSFVKQRTPVYRKIYDEEKIRQSKTRYTVESTDKNRIVGDILDETVGKIKKGTRIKLDNYKKFMKNATENGKTQVKIRLSDGHIDARAKRKMVKIFMQHYWMIGRQLKGLEIGLPYPHEKLGHKSFIQPPENPFKKPNKI